MLDQNLGYLTIPRTSFTTKEVAKMMGKANYTVREWCRLGQIEAYKSGRCGHSEIWRISTKELGRFQDEGLLPIDLYRNKTSKGK